MGQRRSCEAYPANDGFRQVRSSVLSHRPFASIASEIRQSQEAAAAADVALRQMLEAIVEHDWGAVENYRLETVTCFEAQLDHLIAANRMLQNRNRNHD